jgi:hypothetical protein
MICVRPRTLMLAIGIVWPGVGTCVGCIPYQSQVEANVPRAADFDRLMRRDLAAHFPEARNADVRVEYELLRPRPT